MLRPLLNISIILCLTTLVSSFEHVFRHRLLSRQRYAYNHLSNNVEDQAEARMKPCCYPKVWQGIFYRQSSQTDVDFFLQWFEDDNKKMIAVNVTGTDETGAVVEQFMQIAQYNTKVSNMVVYSVQPSAKKCYTDVINATYDQLAMECIPADALYFGMLNMGIPKGGANLAVHSFMWSPEPTEAPHIHYERVVTEDCAPVLGILRGTLHDQEILQSDYYFNIQTSISDPSIFDIPDYCKPPTTQRKFINFSSTYFGLAANPKLKFRGALNL